MLEGYLEFFISSNLAIDNDVEAYSGEVISDFFAVYGFVMVAIMPIHFLYIVFSSDSELQKVKDEKKWLSYFHGVHLRDKWTQFFYFFFMIRRIIYVLLAFNTSTIIF